MTGIPVLFLYLLIECTLKSSSRNNMIKTTIFVSMRRMRMSMRTTMMLDESFRDGYDNDHINIMKITLMIEKQKTKVISSRKPVTQGGSCESKEYRGDPNHQDGHQTGSVLFILGITCFFTILISTLHSVFIIRFSSRRSGRIRRI